MLNFIMYMANQRLSYLSMIATVYLVGGVFSIALLNLLTSIGDAPVNMEFNANNMVKYGFFWGSALIAFVTVKKPVRNYNN